MNDAQQHDPAASVKPGGQRSLKWGIYSLCVGGVAAVLGLQVRCYSLAGVSPPSTPIYTTKEGCPFVRLFVVRAFEDKQLLDPLTDLHQIWHR